METALTFYLTTGVLGCLALAIVGHHTILDVAIVLCALGVVAIFWRNRRRLQRLQQAQVVPPCEVDAGVAITGHSAIPGRAGRGSKLDLSSGRSRW